MGRPKNPNPTPGYQASTRCKFCGCFAQYREEGGNNCYIYSCTNCERTFPVHASNRARA